MYFPHKLYAMLDDPKNIQYISWHPLGGFYIHNLELLCQNVLGKYFKSILPSNLKRQLQMYGFKMVFKNPETGVLFYTHNESWFHKDNPHLLKKIVMAVKEQRNQTLRNRLFYLRKKRPVPDFRTRINLNSSGTTDSSSETEPESYSLCETKTKTSSSESSTESSSESSTESLSESSEMTKREKWDAIIADIIRKQDEIEAPFVKGELEKWARESRKRLFANYPTTRL